MSILEIDCYGNLRWYNDRLHWHRNNDLPAIIGANGTMYWYEDNKIHRDGDFPAIIWEDGSKWWYKNNARHRDFGKPAVILSNGVVEYWVDGVKKGPL